ncbi:MAG TPA: lipopolysaccharide assembly protein LapB [Burkholderiaceae bacterium]|nr:lipopolysaccharide assembly protein LapB [Burkholderiaceae bacterium]
MDLQLWYLLALPLLFLIGWWARGYEARVREADQGGAPHSLFRGLNLLLNDQPDRAIDAFIAIAKVDPETIELHYALGNLFRRRGEFERAVRIHNYLLSRADLPAAERANALSELAQDYLKGGLLDRAEASFGQLVEDPRHRFDALRALLRIHAMERDWDGAIDCARRLEREAGEMHRIAIAHFHCEIAERAVAKNDLEGAKRSLEEALVANRNSVRASILAGDIADRSGNTALAIEHWLRIATDSPEYLPLIAERLTRAMDSVGRRAEALNLLRRELLDHPSVDLLDVGYRRAQEWEGGASGEAMLREELKRHPSLLGFERLLAIRAASAQGDRELELLRGLISVQARNLSRYRCANCGFRTRAFHWQCPGCLHWDSYSPKRIEELDAVA